MIIRHAEKPGLYNKILYNGIDAVGKQDPSSLVTMGWERAGGVATLFDPSNGAFLPGLAAPTSIYAASPLPQTPAKYKTEPNGNMIEDETSKRPYQTISALSAKLGLTVNTSFVADDYATMVSNVITQSGIVLIAWQHQDILPKTTGADSIVQELFFQTGTIASAMAPIPQNFNVPAGPWPGDRYDMVFVLDLSSTTGQIASFTQVPQMLLAGDLDTPF